MELYVRELTQPEDSYWALEPRLQYFESPARVPDENLKALVLGRRYYVRIDLFDRERHPIFLNALLGFNFNVNSTLFRVVEHRLYEYLVEPLQTIQETVISARLASVNNKASRLESSHYLSYHIEAKRSF